MWWCCTCSFLGDTSAGKSHTIRELLGSKEARKPFVQRAAAQFASTTANVNLYMCRELCTDAMVALLGTSAFACSSAGALQSPAACVHVSGVVADHCFIFAVVGLQTLKGRMAPVPQSCSAQGWLGHRRLPGTQRCSSSCLGLPMYPQTLCVW
jgi:hypothetical protein